ncbi:50S ribosomal protein L11 methyltransferase [Qipengyuania psychrotolerans]|uniref:Ribosomal protein L11 methyltransferase n=1 Tax=Qipengyuania psychrotolerans TaxID=2867238 RepID=A0ABX8ZKP7_9SPHN|nr:50S ribosomal protein L11 methyltransferase [Qipengyuania psychrotolerans]QZD88102.1 50S ribosomal protein L11 methyltransferase [Qipengyuania psychrotolerans]
MSAWKLSTEAPKPVVQAALLAHDEAWDFPEELVVSGREIQEDKPDDWILEVWLERKPTAADKRAVTALFEGRSCKFQTEQLPDQDWVTLSQQGVEPIRAGRFHVRTPDHDPDPQMVDFAIPASQAFGTGQHETTAACLAMLDLMKREGLSVRNHADIGTGTGLLAFAAMHLWPAALATASDIDEVCAEVVEENAMANGVPLGGGGGELTMIIAPGMDHPLLRARAPYDLLIANILAGPLVELAPDFAQSITPGGSLLLAGLLQTQEAEVRRAYRAQGLRLARRVTNGDWSILWLRKSRVR